MKTALLSLSLTVIMFGCGGAASDADSTYVAGDDTGVGADGATDPTTDSDTPTTPGAKPTGLPCDVTDVLAASCTKCHGSPLQEGAPYALLSYDDLARMSPKDKTVSVAQRCVTRMKDSASPMPPAPDAPATAAQIATLQAWIDAGMPKGTCGSTPAGDAGGVTDTGPSPYDVPAKCSSGLTWFLGDKGSSMMHPGKACIACHKTHSGAPRFTAAGTVFPTAHEPDDCISRVSGATVVLTGADGKSVSLAVNSYSGNFSYTGLLALPYKAKVVVGGKERKMSAAQTNGDCNACHTQTGTSDAPGRIIVP